MTIFRLGVRDVLDAELHDDELSLRGHLEAHVRECQTLLAQPVILTNRRARRMWNAAQKDRQKTSA